MYAEKFANDVAAEARRAEAQRAGIGAGRAANVKNCELCARTIAEVATTSKVIVEKEACHFVGDFNIGEAGMPVCKNERTRARVHI